MSNLNLGRIFLAILGLISTIAGIFYSKKEHDKFRKSASCYGVPGDLLGSIIIGMVSIFPWYVAKSLFIFLGILFFIFFAVTFFLK
jgi:Co/Zn/Cd efflux system component